MMLKKSLLIIAAALALFAFTESATDTHKVVVHHTVTTGQTMQGIALKLAYEYGDKRDWREIVYHAQVASGKYRDIDGRRYYNSLIRPGEVLTYVLEVE